MTTFRILIQDERCTELGHWEEAGTQEAHSADGAIRAFYLKKPHPDVLAAVAVPARSWRPQRIRVEVTERIVLGAPQVEEKA